MKTLRIAFVPSLVLLAGFALLVPAIAAAQNNPVPPKEWEKIRTRLTKAGCPPTETETETEKPAQ